LSNYTQSTNFATKDALSPGDPLKIVRGTEINTEFTNIAVAVATKFDTTALASPGPIGATTPSTINATTVTASGNVQMASANGGQLAGLRNRVINGAMRIDQRQNGGSITITSAGVYTVDRSFSAATGANLTGNRTASGLAGLPFATQFLGAASNTAAQLGQRIEAANIQDFVTGTTITISCYIYSSAAFTPTWQWITATSTDTTYSTVGDSGSFAAVPATTWTRVTATFAAPANTTNGAQVTILLGATLAGVTKLVTGLQVEVGPVATPFEQRPIGMELALCQRYLPQGNGASGWAYALNSGQYAFSFPVTPRVGPTGVTVISHATLTSTGATAQISNSAVFAGSGTQNCGIVNLSSAANFASTAGFGSMATNGNYLFTGCEL